jgi:hypothetical protein
MNKQLQNKLKAYSALTAVATLVAASADAQNIVHTTVGYTGGMETYDIDIDGDGTTDFSINGWDWGASYYNFVLPNYGYQLNILCAGVNQIAMRTFTSTGSTGALVASSYYVAKLDAGVAVSPALLGFGVNNSMQGGWYWNNGGNFGGASYNTSWGSPGGWGQEWAGGQTGYVGVQFDVSGSTHFGWLRIQVDANFGSWELIDMAYNATPDEQIITGQTLNVKENKRNTNIFVDADNVNIMTDGSLMNAKVDVVNMLGQSVAKTVITSNATAIAKSFGSGIFIVRISDENGKVITRKIKI